MNIWSITLVSVCCNSNVSSFLATPHVSATKNALQSSDQFSPSLSKLYFSDNDDDDDSTYLLHHVNNALRGGGYNKNENNTLRSLSVTELKRILNDRGVDYRDGLEKQDLVDRVISSQGTASSSSPGYSGSSSSSGLSHEENRVVNTFTSTSPSVAYIQTVNQQQTIQGFSLKGTEVPTGAGSGFLWDNNGHIVTNYHVIASAAKKPNAVIKVKLQGMEPISAKIVGYEAEKDLAVLRIPTRNLPTPISVGSSSDLQVGQNVLAIGNPFGLDYTLTTGVVSALGREVNGVGGRPIKGCIQTDASINPGNSGGPLLDSRGRLIGVNMAIYSPSGASAGIGFSIPVDTVRRVVNQIIRHGRVIRPSLGINVADDRLLQSIKMQLRKDLNGVLIVEVLKGSPAEASNLKASELRSDGTIILGDLITHVNDEPIVSVEDLLSAIESKSDGETVSVKLWRECDKRKATEVQVKLTSNQKLNRSSRKESLSGSAWQ